MKKILLAVFAVGLFSFAGTASADVCGQNYISTMVTDPVTLVVTTVVTPGAYLGCGNMDPLKVVQAWGLDGYHTPRVTRGTWITDFRGAKDYCPLWYQADCFDISNTSYYMGLNYFKAGL